MGVGQFGSWGEQGFSAGSLGWGSVGGGAAGRVGLFGLLAASLQFAPAGVGNQLVGQDAGFELRQEP